MNVYRYTGSVCFHQHSVKRQSYDFTYPQPWSESITTVDGDDLIIPFSCNYPPPPPSFLLLFSLLLHKYSALFLFFSQPITFSYIQPFSFQSSLPNTYVLWPQHSVSRLHIHLFLSLCQICSPFLFPVQKKTEYRKEYSNRVQQFT